MEEILANPNGVRLYHDRGQQFDLRIHDQSVLGVFSLSWSFRGALGQHVDMQSTRMAVADISHDRRHGTVRLEYPPYGGARVGVRFRIRDGGLVIQQYLQCRHCGAGDPLALWSFAVEGEDTRASFLAGLGRDPGWRFFPLGYNSFTPAWSRDSRDVQKPPRFPTVSIFNQYVDSAYWGRSDVLSTPWMATIQRTGIDSTVLLGFLEAAVSLGEVALVRGDTTRVVLRSDFGGKVVDADEEVCSDPVLVAFGQDGDALLHSWTSEVGERMKARTHQGESLPAGVPGTTTTLESGSRTCSTTSLCLPGTRTGCRSPTCSLTMATRHSWGTGCPRIESSWEG